MPDVETLSYKLGELTSGLASLQAEVRELNLRMPARLERIESRVDALETANDKQSVYTRVFDKTAWLVIGGMVAALAERYV